MTEIQRRPAGPDHEVVTFSTPHKDHYRRTPCGGCPWVVENTGDFPSEAFGHSARTSYDASDHVFSCHESGQERPSTCAGFLLRNADNNLAIRMRIALGKLNPDEVHEDGRELHASYRDMAIANGMDPDDERLKECRGNNE